MMGPFTSLFVTRWGPHLKLDHGPMSRQDLDMHVVIRLRRGAVELEGTDERAGKRITLYREEVAPLRLSTPFAQPDADTKQ
jgi:hypothetical protein